MRRLVLILIGLTLAMAFIPQSQADHDHRIRLNGTIADVGDAGIVLHTRDGNVRIHVTPDTRISLNGHPARLGDLMPRDRAEVVARHRGDRHDRRLVALSIRARGHR